MGLNRILKLFCFLLCFLFLLIKSSSVLNHESIQPKIDDSEEAAHYRVLYMKKTKKPFFLDKEEVNKRRKMRLKNKKMMKEFKTSSTVSAMLPKGFVPPSGSGAPCHNRKHNADFTFCDLSTANNNKP